MEEINYFIPPAARPKVNDTLLKNAWEVAYLLESFLQEGRSSGLSVNINQLFCDGTDTGKEG